MNASPRINRPHPIDPTTEPERRKLRKGTQSCWECKRRKVRCNFTATTDLTCDGCKRRKTTCTSQEFPDDSVRTASSSQLSDRLAQLETVVERLIKKIDVADKPGNASNEEDLRDKTRCPQTIDGSSTNNAITIVLNDPMANLVDQHVCCSLVRLLGFVLPTYLHSDTTLALSSRGISDKAELSIGKQGYYPRTRLQAC